MAIAMADWSSLTGSPSANDFLSMYTSRSRLPSHKTTGTLPSELQFTPSPNKTKNQCIKEESHTIFNELSMCSISENQAKFCHKDNIEQCTAVLNQEVTALGMPSLYEDKCGQVDMVRLVNCVYELLQKHQRSLRLREELENRQHRTESDINMLHTAQKHLKEELERNERELVKLQEKERQLMIKNRLLTTKLKAEKDEVRRLQSVIEHRDAQYRHELKRKEREYMKLKDKLQQMLSSKTDRKIAIDIVSPMPRATGKRGKWQKGGNMEEEMYRQVINTYEEKHKELLVENSEMRQCLSQMQSELVALLHSPTKPAIERSNSTISENSLQMKDISTHSESDGENDLYSAHVDDLKDAHFQMPYDMVRENIEKNLKQKCKLLKQYIRKIEKQKGESQAQKVKASPARAEESHKKEVDKLNKQVERCREIIDQQEKLLQQHLQEQTGLNITSEPSFLRDSEIWEDRESLHKQKHLFVEQKTNFDRERKIFTDAAIRLGKEKKAFEDEKAKVLQNQFSLLTPFHDNMSATSKRTRRVLPCTPSQPLYTTDNLALTPSTSTPVLQQRPHSASTPSTSDLYHRLGLRPVAEIVTQNSMRLAQAESPIGVYNKVLNDLEENKQPFSPPCSLPDTTSPGSQDNTLPDLQIPVSNSLDDVTYRLFGPEDGD